jgi:formylglycine-generating enzyme required for sulfatase activity
MIGLNYFRNPAMKLMLVIICLLMVFTGLPANYDSQYNRWKGIYNWAKKHYFEGRYRETEKKLNLLLSFINVASELEKKDNFPVKRLIGDTWLMKGAIDEKMGEINEAITYYNKVKAISLQLSKQGHAEIKLNDIDIHSLPKAKHLFSVPHKPVGASARGMILNESPKPKKKKSSLLFIAAAVVAVGVAAVLLLSKKKEKVVQPPEFNPNFDTGVLGIDWVFIGSGTFNMGSEGEKANIDEQPVHSVRLSTYYISRNEITFSQYLQFASEQGLPTPDDNGWGYAERPVVNISWGYASQFCQWLSDKTGKQIHLPTEAQWEKAASWRDPAALEPSLYPWGNTDPTCLNTNWCCQEFTDPVGSHAWGASYYGIQDMAGNVAEWCRDWYSESYYSNSPLNDPQGPVGEGNSFLYNKVVRGGSTRCDSDIRITARDRRQIQAFGSSTTILYPDVGFRIVWEPN